jgi:hypothetical protein
MLFIWASLDVYRRTNATKRFAEAFLRQLAFRQCVTSHGRISLSRLHDSLAIEVVQVNPQAIDGEPLGAEQ